MSSDGRAAFKCSDAIGLERLFQCCRITGVVRCAPLMDSRQPCAYHPLRFSRLVSFFIHAHIFRMLERPIGRSYVS
jgi:hypothetical protein